jgi:anti-sigma B factor antagonist/stage II sporulation protein AA (anti-sigma F factor antagonist)
VQHADIPSLRITVAREGSTSLVRLAGELDLATAEELRARVRELRREPRLVFDLAGVEFLDVTGLGVLLETSRLLAEHGGSVLLRRPRPMVRRMLSLLKLEDALHVED